MKIEIEVLETANRQIAENRIILIAIIEAILFTARQNIAWKGHDEGYRSSNRGNFLELIKLLPKYHAPLKYHLDKIEENKNKNNRVTFLSNVTQNSILNILANMVRSIILMKVKDLVTFQLLFIQPQTFRILSNLRLS